MTPTEEALGMRACAVFGISADVSEVDPEGDLFSWDGAGGHGGMIDSLAIVEFLMAVGDELDLEVIDLVDEADIRTLRQLGQVVDERAAPDALARFHERWASSEPGIA